MHSFQSGFRKKHGTTTALLKVSHDLRVAIDNKRLIYLNGVEIPFQQKVKNLVVIFDNTLTWKYHINYISQRVYCVLRRLWRHAYLTPLRTRMKLFSSLILPFFTYCDVVFNPLDSAGQSKINVIFNLCTRGMCSV